MATNIQGTDVDLAAALQQHFGFEQFRLGQREVITNLMAGQSAAAVFPTGSGKSLCYQLPALLLDGLTLVVSPLIALMKDQIDTLRARGISARRLDSTLTSEEHQAAMVDLRSGGLRLLYVAPERFTNERFRQLMLETDVALFAVDEAHCISEWGHHFRPDYLKLAEFARHCRAQRVLALTATATPQVLTDICKAFEIQTDCATCTGFYRPNLTLLIETVQSHERDDLLLRRLQSRVPGPTVVYVTTQKTTEELAERLRQAGFPAKPYHAGMQAEQRSSTQDWFLSSDSGIVVATIAFGMGVDKPDIRYVYHYNLPKSLENYSQEVGRAGRDGEQATCEMLLCRDDLAILENFVYRSTPTHEAVAELVTTIFQQDEAFDISYSELASQCNIRLLVVRTLITYLELDGYLEGGTPFYANYRFKALKSSPQILALFEGERREFLRKIFHCSRKAKTWFHVDVNRAAEAANATRERVVAALDFLGERRLLEVCAEGVRHRFRRLRGCGDVKPLAEKLYTQVRRREEREIGRLHQVVALAERGQCQVGRLCAHFGEQLARPCGHCSGCREKGMKEA